MKLSKRTLSILKNYSYINNSIKVSSGNSLEIVSDDNLIISESSIEEFFPVDFAIGKLNDFLSAYSLFKDNEPELTFGQHSVILEADDKQIEYFYTSRNRINQENFLKNIQLEKSILEFHIEWNDIQSAIIAANSLELKNILIEKNDDQTINIVSTNTDTPASNIFKFSVKNISKVEGNAVKLLFRSEDWKLLKGTYTISVFLNAKKTAAITKFKHDSELIYYIGTKLV